MIKVFIGGSRRVTRLNADVRRRLDRIIEKRLLVLIGDANGADKAVQRHLQSRGYDRVEVFCMEGICRNNVGNWTTRVVAAPKGARGFEYYAVKDEQMTNESSVGFMLWDGKSRGTLANISRLVEHRKKVVVYIAPTREFATVRNRGDWETFLSHWDKESQKQAKRHAASYERQLVNTRQVDLF